MQIGKKPSAPFFILVVFISAFCIMSQSGNKSKFFKWTEEEEALLLKVIHDYKTSKLMGGQDWETVRSKYEDIKEKFISNYPNEESEEFPNFKSKDQFTKERLAAKIKKIKTSFRKAVDSGRRSGGGRVTYALYNECYEIWAGCPAVESLDDGVESSSIKSYSAAEDDSPASFLLLEHDENDFTNDNRDISVTNNQPSSSSKETSDADIVEPLKKKMKTKREELTKVLKDRRNGKSIKQVSAQEQLLVIAKEEAAARNEELELKRKLIEQFENSEKRFYESMQQFSTTMSRTMLEGFGMISQMLQQNGPSHFQFAHNYGENWGNQQAFQQPNNCPNGNFNASTNYTDL